MTSIEYSLFRAKFVKPRQTAFSHTEDLTPRDFFIRALSERLSSELRKGSIWHIGNIKNFSDNTGYFAIGRTTDSTIAKFDDITGNFVEEDLKESPYTHCVFDARIGIIGIAKKSSLAQTAKGVAKRIEQLLSISSVIRDNDISVEIKPIPDPEDFLRLLATAYRITRFSATFRGPNPFDADEYFQKPLSVYLSATNGDKGKAQVQGEDLNKDVLQNVTRSTAATGNEASARIIKIKSEKSIMISLKGDPVKRRYDEDEHKPEIVLADLTNLYHRVRNDERA